MYLLYRYARSAKPRSYMLDITLFIIAVSLFSTVFLVSFFGVPVSFVSFPFYFWYGELPAPGWLSQQVRELYPWLYYRGIRFLTVDVTLDPNWEVKGDQVILHYNVWDNYNNALVIGFSVFLLVNILGALVGYGVGKRYRIQLLSDDFWIGIGMVCVGVSFVLPRALLAYYLPLFGLGIILLGTVFFSWLIHYYTRARVATLMILTGIILLLMGNPINAIEMIVGGRMLICLAS